MAKGQKRSNREIKKPKQVKVAAPAASPFGAVKSGAQTGGGKKS